MCTLLLVAAAVRAQLPSVQLKDLEGKTVDTSKLSNDGKPFVISFLLHGVSLVIGS